jgi:co-chaperonin GroES (HSP10)
LEMNSSGISVSGDRVLVLVEDLEEITEGGIIIAESALKQHGMSNVFGKLIDVGPDCWDDRTEVYADIGDRIVFAKFGGLFITGEDGIEYRIFNDTDIIARVTNEVKYAGLEPRKPVGER